jgi:glycosyltransferase involved in cell wall biosynthesis
MELIYDPATRVPRTPAEPSATGRLRLLSMGNIGRSQGLTALLHAFESHPELEATLHITGTGVAANEARREVRSDRVKMLGIVDDERLENELRSADIGFVSQHYDGSEFNVPSKLMNYMTYGLPVLAAVNPASEVARIVRESRGGWVVDSRYPDSFPAEVARLSRADGELGERARAARRYAEVHFTSDGFVDRFERVLEEVTAFS